MGTTPEWVVWATGGAMWAADCSATLATDGDVMWATDGGAMWATGGGAMWAANGGAMCLLAIGPNISLSHKCITSITV